MEPNQELFDAVAKNDVERARSSLKLGASPLWANSLYGKYSAFHKAVENKSADCVRLLLDHTLREAIRSGDESAVDIISETLAKQFADGTIFAPSVSPLANAVTHPQYDLTTRMERALAAIKRGEFVIVMDGEDRENEGDLIMAAELATPEAIAFMVNETSGLICVGIEASRCEELKLEQMVKHNTESHSTAFTHSIDYKIGTTTGISAADRAVTMRALTDKSAKPSDFARPGHVFPLRARDGGVLVRPGHTESAVDLAKLAGLYPAGVLCEIVNKDGTMARAPRCREFAKQHGLEFITIADIIEYRKAQEKRSASS